LGAIKNAEIIRDATVMRFTVRSRYDMAWFSICLDDIAQPKSYGKRWVNKIDEIRRHLSIEDRLSSFFTVYPVPYH